MHDLRQGDCREVMRGLDADSIDAIVTDPPYGLEFMGKDWDAPWQASSKSALFGKRDREMPGWSVTRNPNCRECGGRLRGARKCSCVTPSWDEAPTATHVRQMRAFQEWCATWAVEALRVLKPGGHLLAFGGSRTYHRMVCAIEDAGFEIRDQIQWLYGSGFPKSLNIGDGWGTALKPAHEPIVVARKPLQGTVAANVARWGTGALNIDGCRVEASAKDVAAAAVPARNNLRFCQQDGRGRADNVHDMSAGRWPANLIHDGSDEVLAAFAIAGERQSRGGNPKRQVPRTGVAYGNYSGDADKTVHNDTGTAARFFYCAKASKTDRDAGLEGMPEVSVGTMQDDAYQWQVDGKGNRINLDTKRRNTHPCVKPTNLMRYLCRLVTPPGGTILDPFMGSGSTGRGAVLEGFSFIGIETDADYIAIAERRIAHAEREPAPDLFSLVAAE